MDLSNYSYDALLFDCDGTLVNTAPLHFEAFRLALGDQGATIDRDWYNERLSLTRVDLISSFDAQTTLDINIDSAATASELHFLTLVDQIEIIPEVVDIAKTHDGIVPMAVASSGQRLSVLTSLQSAGIKEFFAEIVTAEEVLKHKPAPDSYIKAAERLGVLPEKCLVFEDTDEGLESATCAGAIAIDVRSFASIYSPL